MKITISQEGSSPISIDIDDMKAAAVSTESVGSKLISKTKRSKSVSCKNPAEYFANEELKSACSFIASQAGVLKKQTEVIDLATAKVMKCKLFHRNPQDSNVNGIDIKYLEKKIAGIPVILCTCKVDNAYVGTSQIWFKDKSGKCYGVIVHPNIYFTTAQ